MGGSGGQQNSNVNANNPGKGEDMFTKELLSRPDSKYVQQQNKLNMLINQPPNPNGPQQNSNQSDTKYTSGTGMSHLNTGSKYEVGSKEFLISSVHDPTGLDSGLNFPSSGCQQNSNSGTTQQNSSHNNTPGMTSPNMYGASPSTAHHHLQGMLPPGLPHFSNQNNNHTPNSKQMAKYHQQFRGMFPDSGKRETAAEEVNRHLHKLVDDISMPQEAQTLAVSIFEELICAQVTDMYGSDNVSAHLFGSSKNLTLLKDSDFDVGLMFTQDSTMHKLCSPKDFIKTHGGAGDNSENNNNIGSELVSVKEHQSSDSDGSDEKQVAVAKLDNPADSTSSSEKGDKDNEKPANNTTTNIVEPSSNTGNTMSCPVETFLQKHYGEALAQMEAAGMCPQSISSGSSTNTSTTGGIRSAIDNNAASRQTGAAGLSSVCETKEPSSTASKNPNEAADAAASGNSTAKTDKKDRKDSAEAPGSSSSSSASVIPGKKRDTTASQIPEKM